MSSSDGMTIGAPTAVVMDGRDAMIAIGMNGEPLPIEHGFPARIVVPGLYGYVSACKWVVDIEATTFADAAAYWVQGGWAPNRPTSSWPRASTRRERRQGAGRAAGGRGRRRLGPARRRVARSRSRSNDGDWLPARLASVPSTDTWRQWVVSWTPPRRLLHASGPGHRCRGRSPDRAGRPTRSRTAPPDCTPSASGPGDQQLNRPAPLRSNGYEASCVGAWPSWPPPAWVSTRTRTATSPTVPVQHAPARSTRGCCSRSRRRWRSSPAL